MSDLFSLSGPLGPYLLVILVGFLPSEVWRLLGVFLSRRLNEESEVFVWIRAVASAILAGVAAKLVFYPNGVLAHVPFLGRMASLLIGLGGYFLLKRSVLAGVAVGEVALALTIWLTQ